MATKLIRLNDGMLIEVEASDNDVQQISFRAADQVQNTLDQVKPMLIQTCIPVIAAWKELNKEMFIKEAKIEMGLSFEGEGNIYVTKFKAGANLTIELTLKEDPNDTKPEKQDV